VKRKPLKLTDYGPAPGRLDAAVEWLLAGMLAFMPLALGAVEPWSEFVAVAAALALAVLLVARRLGRPDCPPGWTWAYVPLALFVLLALLQLAALPESLVHSLSPGTVAEKRRLLADLPAGPAGSAPTTLSFYALATRHDLRVVLVAAAVFAAVVEVYRRPEQVRRLLLTVTCVGGAVALLALAQQATRANQIYWVVRLPTGSVADGGPFVNHNNFAQFMNLSIGAALGLLLVKLRDLGVGADLQPADVAAALREPEARPAVAYAGVVVAGVVAVFLSMSRGGMVGLLAGLALATLVLGRQRHLRAQGWVLALLGLAGFVALLYLGFDAVYERLVAVRDLPEAAGGRFELVRDAVGVWRKFPLFGVGLGTHAWVFPAYDRTEAAQLAQYVENDYVQALEETGVLGLALVLLFAGFIWYHFFRASAAQRPRVCAASVGLGFGLLAVMVQSASDFGQHVPAVAALSAVTCGLLVAMSRLAARARRAQEAAGDAAAGGDPAAGPAGESAPAAQQQPAPRRRPRLAAAVVPVAAAVLLAWSALDANDVRVAADHSSAAGRVAATLARAGWDGSDEDFTRLLQSAGDASSASPGDVELRYWLNTYRWRALARERDEESGDLLLTEEALGHTARIVDELHAARPLCPSYGPLVSLAGQLELFVLGRDVGREHIAASYALAPNHPDVVFTAALADAERGAWDGAVAKFRRVVKLSPEMVPEVIRVLETQYDRPDLAVAAAAGGDDAGALMQLSQRIRARGGDEAVARDAWRAGVEALERVCAKPDPSPGAVAALANAYRTDGRREEAIFAYRRALVLEYGRVEWRLELARLLEAAGRRPEALREAQICLRLRPASEEARTLVGQLIVPAAAATSAPSDPGRGAVDRGAAQGATRPTAAGG
jgi:O-antigen ligase/tetratricopeptide (TPR) repeat protein